MKPKIMASLVAVALFVVYIAVQPLFFQEEPLPNTKVEIPITAASQVRINAGNVEKLDIIKSQIQSLIEGERTRYSIFIKPIGNQAVITINSESMRAASMIKIFIMIEAFRQQQDGRVSFAEIIPITRDVRVGGSGKLQNDPAGSARTFRELVELMITDSDNTATNIAIEKLGMNNINETIKCLGCKDTILQRKMMDFASAGNGRENYTSVTDLAVVLEKLYFGQCVNTKSDMEMLEILKRQEDNDKIPALLPVGTPVAHKTGELEGAIHDGGIIWGKGQSFILCIMTEDVQDSGRTTDIIAKVSKLAYDQLIAVP